MRRDRGLWSFAGSLFLHGLALAALIALVARESAPPILIVELEEAIRVQGESPPAAPARPGSRAGRRLDGSRRELSPGFEPLPPRPVVPALPSLPEPTPAPSAPALAEPPAPVPALAATPAPAYAPAPAPAFVPVPGTEGAGGEPDAEALPPGSESGRAGAVGESSGQSIGGFTGESTGGGFPAGAPLALMVPSEGSGGTGARGGPSASAPGGGDSGVPVEFGPYLETFRKRIQESLAYPLAARRRGLDGTVQLEVELLPSGRVASVVVRSSSSHAVLDQAALETVSQLRPVPFPPGVPARPLKVRLPITFQLK